MIILDLSLIAQYSELLKVWSIQEYFSIIKHIALCLIWF